MKRTFKQFLESQPEKFEPKDDWLSLDSIKQIWADVNTKIFGNLNEPEFTLEADLDYLVPVENRPENAHIMGYCDNKGANGITLRFCERIKDVKELINVVVHEMVHQALAQRHGYDEMCDIDHGDQFMAFAKIVKRYHGVNLSQTLEYDNQSF